MQISQRARRMAESATMAVSGRAAQLRREGVDVVSFGAGEPDFDTPEHIKLAAIDALQQGQTGYARPGVGNPAPEGGDHRPRCGAMPASNTDPTRSSSPAAARRPFFWPLRPFWIRAMR